MLRWTCVLLAVVSLVAPPRAAAQTDVQAGGQAGGNPFGHLPPDALQASREYQKTGNARVMREGAFLVFPFGHQQPQLTCAPLFHCNVLLNSDESIERLISGDAGQLWDISDVPGPYGARLVVIRPHFCDVSTILTISTTKRLYSLSLDSPPCGKDVEEGVNRTDRNYVRFVRYYYPDETIRRAEAADSARGAEERRTVQLAPGVLDPSQLHLDYEIRRMKAFPWKPTAIFDDGQRTYIRLPREAFRMEPPLLYVEGPGGTAEVVGYEYPTEEKGFLEVGQVLERAYLVYGGPRGEAVKLFIQRKGGQR